MVVVVAAMMQGFMRGVVGERMGEVPVKQMGRSRGQRVSVVWVVVREARWEKNGERRWAVRVIEGYARIVIHRLAFGTCVGLRRRIVRMPRRMARGVMR